MVSEGREELGFPQFHRFPLGPLPQAATTSVYQGAAREQTLTQVLHFIFIAAFSASVPLSNEITLSNEMIL